MVLTGSVSQSVSVCVVRLLFTTTGLSREEHTRGRLHIASLSQNNCIFECLFSNDPVSCAHLTVRTRLPNATSSLFLVNRELSYFYPLFLDAFLTPYPIPIVENFYKVVTHTHTRVRWVWDMPNVFHMHCICVSTRMWRRPPSM